MIFIFVETSKNITWARHALTLEGGKAIVSPSPLLELSYNQHVRVIDCQKKRREIVRAKANLPLHTPKHMWDITKKKVCIRIFTYSRNY